MDNDFMAKYQALEDTRQDTLEVNLKELKKVLIDQEIDKVVIDFEGGNDDGDISDVILSSEVKDSASMVEYNKVGSRNVDDIQVMPISISVKDFIQEVMSDLVFSRYYTFAGDFRVEGQVSFNKEGKILWTGEESTVEYFEDENEI